MRLLRRDFFRCTKIWIVVCTVVGFGCLIVGLCWYFLRDTAENVEEKRLEFSSLWQWVCIQDRCHKTLIRSNNKTDALSLPACQLVCSDTATLWPKPTGNITVGHVLTKINQNNIDIVGYKTKTPISELIKKAGRIFKEEIQARSEGFSTLKNGKSLIINVNIQNTNAARLTLATNESYVLKAYQATDDRIHAHISAQTFFGFRHGLQTLNQLIIFDDIRGEIQMPRDIFITDAPAYPYRGLMLDTARNYASVSTIKRTLTAMSASKLNTFHWHIVDSHSFPYISPSRPELAQFGAYSPRKVYTPDDVAEIIDHATVRGIRVIPEFDAPGHVGEGWQNTSFVVCFNSQPWVLHCVEPPCGQFDPTQDTLYDVLEDLYSDMIQQFQPDIFHMGGDEVNFACWLDSENINDWMKQRNWDLDEKGCVNLWNYFQKNALKRLYSTADNEIPIMMWSSTLTRENYLLDSLPKDQYIIQVWTPLNDSQADLLLKNDYKIVISNQDALYLDCGYAAWVSDGNNWCSPYIGWQTIYDNTIPQIAGNRSKQVLGQEALLWTEEADSASIDSKLWPRAAAMAEVVWSEPKTGWEAVEQRMLLHRERLIQLGINADSIQPEWCMQNEENCIIRY